MTRRPLAGEQWQRIGSRRGRLSVFRVVGSYRWAPDKPLNFGDQFGHLLPVEILSRDIDRHGPRVSDGLRAILRVQTRLYNITGYGGDVELLLGNKPSRDRSGEFSTEDEYGVCSIGSQRTAPARPTTRSRFLPPSSGGRPMPSAGGGMTARLPSPEVPSPQRASRSRRGSIGDSKMSRHGHLREVRAKSPRRLALWRRGARPFRSARRSSRP
jgi:hypothetical protein